MSKKKAKQDTPIRKDRPAGKNDRELDNGLIYGRWYGGAMQNCGCHSVPEGMHHPGCEMGLCTTKRAEPEVVDQAEHAEAA